MKAGLPLGLYDNTDYPPQTIAFEPGDMLLAYTDPFFEAQDKEGTLLQTEGLVKLMDAAPTDSLENTVNWLIGQIEAMSSGNLINDDATAILLEPTGSGIPMKNNLMAPIRMVQGVTETAPAKPGS